MPRLIAQPNPPPEPSRLPESLLNLKVHLNVTETLSRDELSAVKAFRHAGCYISAAMLFLRDNILLERKLTKMDVKPRILGHWGTDPGLVLCYAHSSLLVKKNDLNALFVTGPGHGAPAILSCLWLESSLTRFMPCYPLDGKGLHHLISHFSTRGGFPSHVNAQTPGSIHEGGELGYALSVAFGAVMDNPDLIVPCVIGDGEAETGPTATAWHGYKYLDPAESGAVLPIVHVNGFKISQRTIYGCMDDIELVALFSGYGYLVRFVEDLEHIDNDMAASMQWALSEIRKIQKAARSGNPIVKPQWPVLILRTPKGWTGPKELHGKLIEGSFNSHGIPLPNAATDDEEFELLSHWLTSYEPRKLFDKTGRPLPHILSIFPEREEKRMGQNKLSYAGYVPLDVPDWKKFVVEKGAQESCMRLVGEFLHDIITLNPKTFRIWSPDELVSNKLEAVLRENGRNFQWDVASRNQGGRVIEILSEHTCQGMLQGYTLTGRTGLFPSYESFMGIIHTMVIQYSKFVKMAMEVPWRQELSSINYIETSTWTRQEHNGFSHQNPSFIGSILNLKSTVARVYLPPDANCFLSTIAHCLRAKHYVNLIVGSKHPTPVWLSPEDANQHCIAGASVWKFASVKQGHDPHVVLVGIGVEVTMEVLAAASLLRIMCPELRVRVVNVTDLMILSPHGEHPHSLTTDAFNDLFTADRPIHFNYHSYPIELKGLLFGRPNLDNRVTIGGYMEEGTTTTPFDMMLSNHVSRFHVAIAAIAAIRAGAYEGVVGMDKHSLMNNLRHQIEHHKKYALKNAADMDGVYDTPKF